MKKAEVTYNAGPLGALAVATLEGEDFTIWTDEDRTVIDAHVDGEDVRSFHVKSDRIITIDVTTHTEKPA